MKYSEKLKFCKKVNTNPIYQEYSCGVRCVCSRDIYGDERLEVIILGTHNHLSSPICNDWEEDYMLEWIMHATQAIKDYLDLGVKI